MIQNVFRCLLAVLLIAAGALAAFAQDAAGIPAAPTVAAGDRDGGQPAAPGADKEDLARCGLHGLVALIATDSQTPPCDNSNPFNTRNNCLAVLDARNNVIATYTMECLLGSNGGMIFDVAITQDCTALVSNFGDSEVHFIDFSDPLNPLYTGAVNPCFFAEDIALTPDGQYALVTDGGFTPRIAVIRTTTMHLVSVAVTPGIYSNAVAVSSDGQTVLTADYFNSRVNVFLLGEGGALTFVRFFQLSLDPDFGHRPVNLAISPDGRTAIVANSNGTIGPPPYPPLWPYGKNPDLDVFRIDGPGEVHYSGVIHMPYVGGVQSVGFANNSQAFFNYFRWIDYTYQVPDITDPSAPWTTYEDHYPLHYIGCADILGPGVAVNTGIEVATGIKGTSQLFGVDTLVAVPGGPYVYYSNPTVSGGTEDIYVIDLRDYTLIQTIDLPNSNLHVVFDPYYMVAGDGFIPTGIAFRQP